MLSLDLPSSPLPYLPSRSGKAGKQLAAPVSERHFIWQHLSMETPEPETFKRNHKNIQKTNPARSWQVNTALKNPRSSGSYIYPVREMDRRLALSVGSRTDTVTCLKRTAPHQHVRNLLTTKLRLGLDQYIQNRRCSAQKAF